MAEGGVPSSFVDGDGDVLLIDGITTKVAGDYLNQWSLQ
jgi:hypothetical protein